MFYGWSICISYLGIARRSLLGDNAITIHRHRSEDDDYVGVHVHKIRFQYKNGKTGVGKLNYNTRTGKYETHIERPTENLFG